MRRFTTENGRAFTLSPLTRSELAAAKRLCDECVGEDLYSERELAAALDAPDRFFYLLRTDTGETAGYVYYYLDRLDALAAYAKLPPEALRAVCPNAGERVGKLQSIGVDAGYQRLGLAARMLELALDELCALGARAVFIVCWRHGGTVPLKSAVERCDFRYLTRTHNVWYDDAELVCPYCTGRCTCDAEVYYKLLDGEEES